MQIVNQLKMVSIGGAMFGYKQNFKKTLITSHNMAAIFKALLTRFGGTTTNNTTNATLCMIQNFSYGIVKERKAFGLDLIYLYT